MSACIAEESKPSVSENIESVQSDQHFAKFLMRFLLKALHICLVCIGFILSFSYLTNTSHVMCLESCDTWLSGSIDFLTV